MAESARFCHHCGFQADRFRESGSRSGPGRLGTILIALALLLVGAAGVIFLKPNPVPTSPQENSSTDEEEAVSEVAPVNWRENRLMADPPQGETTDDAASEAALGGTLTRDEVASVTFLNSLSGQPEGSWDVPQEQDGSVLAWTEGTGERYDLFIGAEGGMAAPEDCTGLFMGYRNAETIDFNGALHTEGTVSMRDMFSGCESLRVLDVSGFDTSGVTNMSRMFNDCQDLDELDVSGFDTAQVTDMNTMFNYCERLETLDVSGFDTSKVTDMLGMFSGCKSLTDLDVSGFDTGSATVMSYMFCECEELTDLDVRGWDISGVTAMAGMFSLCPRLSNLEADGWDVSHVTHTLSMLYGTPVSATSSGITGLPEGERPSTSGGSSSSGSAGSSSTSSGSSSLGGSGGGTSSSTEIPMSDYERTCSACFGAGVLECKKCGGDGRVSCTYCGGDGGEYELDTGTPLYDGVGSFDRGYIWEDCARCRGSGEQDCRTCMGRGEVDCWGC